MILFQFIQKICDRIIDCQLIHLNNWFNFKNFSYFFLPLTFSLIFQPFLFIADIYSFFVCVVIFASFANGAPQNHHRHGHQSWTSSDDDSDSKMGWVNPCGGEFLATAPTKFENETELRPRNVSLFVPFAVIFGVDFNFV